MGVMLANGLGTAKNEAEALKWYRKAAEQGHVNAQRSLGFMLANGRGTALVSWSMLLGRCYLFVVCELGGQYVVLAFTY